MVASEVVKIVVPNVKRNIPGGGSLCWRFWNRGVLSVAGLLSKGFLNLQRNVRVDGLDRFLSLLESKRDRGIITGTLIMSLANI